MQQAGFVRALSGPVGAGARRAALGLAVCLVSAGCGVRTPVRVLEVQGHVQSLSTSGSVLVGEFLGSRTYIWDWADLRKPAHAVERGRALSVGVLGSQCLFTERPAESRRLQPAVLALERGSRRVLREWAFSANWYCSEFVSSPSGRYMGILLEENNPTGGDTCVGVVGPGVREIPWILAKGRMVKLAEDAMAVANNGRYVALLGMGDIRAAVVVDAAHKRVLWRREMPRSRSVAFSPDSRVLYIAGHYGVYALLGESGHMLSTWSTQDSKGLPAAVTRIAASPDGRFVAAGTDAPDGKIYLFDARTGRLVTWWNVAGKKTLIEGLAFSPGSAYLATADQYTETIQIWNVPQSSGAGHRK